MLSRKISDRSFQSSRYKSMERRSSLLKGRRSWFNATSEIMSASTVQQETAVVGAAYIFDPATGDLQTVLSNPAPKPNDAFGFAVAIGDERAVVTAPGRPIRGERAAGSAYIFDTATGEPLFQLKSPEPNAGDVFGFAIATANNQFFIGAPGYDIDSQDDAGIVYAFDADTGEQTQAFLVDDVQAGDGFGFAIAASDHHLVIGAPYVDADANNSGEAYLFDNLTGDLLQTFEHPDPEANDQFGTAVATLGELTLVGAPGKDINGEDAGSVYLFDNLTGQLLLTIDNPEPNRGDEFGKAIALSDDYLVVGARDDDTDARNSGSVYIFDPVSGELVDTIRNPDPDEADSFGRSIAASGNFILVGSRYESTLAERTGAAYGFNLSQGSNNGRVLDNPNPGPFDLFAHSVAIGDGQVLIGALGDTV